jgi:hypothetical protein
LGETDCSQNESPQSIHQATDGIEKADDADSKPCSVAHQPRMDAVRETDPYKN